MSFGESRRNKRRALAEAYKQCCTAPDRATFISAYTYYYYLRNNRNPDQYSEPDQESLLPASHDVHEELDNRTSEPGWLRQLERYSTIYG